MSRGTPLQSLGEADVPLVALPRQDERIGLPRLRARLETINPTAPRRFAP